MCILHKQFWNSQSDSIWSVLHYSSIRNTDSVRRDTYCAYLTCLNDHFSCFIAHEIFFGSKCLSMMCWSMVVLSCIYFDIFIIVRSFIYLLYSGKSGSDVLDWEHWIQIRRCRCKVMCFCFNRLFVRCLRLYIVLPVVWCQCLTYWIRSEVAFSHIETHAVYMRCSVVRLWHTCFFVLFSAVPPVQLLFYQTLSVTMSSWILCIAVVFKEALKPLQRKTRSVSACSYKAIKGSLHLQNHRIMYSTTH